MFLHPFWFAKTDYKISSFKGMRILLGMSILVFALNSFVWGITDRDFRSKNGQVIRGSIVKYFEDGDVLLKRTSDLQLFRISLDIFTEDDQAFVKNNFPPNHDALPKFKNHSMSELCKHFQNL